MKPDDKSTQPQQEESAQSSSVYDKNYQKRRRYGALILVFIGVLWLLKELPINIPDWLFSWEIFIIGIGLLLGFRRNFKGASWFILIIIGGAFLLKDLFVPDQYDNIIGPVIFIVAGLFFFVFRNRQRHAYASVASFKEARTRKKQADVQSEDKKEKAASAYNDDFLRIENAFSGVKRTIISKNFQGGVVRNIFGGVKLNFLQSTIINTATLRIENGFGGVVLVVPSDWEVIPEVGTIFGGIEDSRTFQSSQEGTRKRLILRGESIFGGLEIKNFD